MAATKFSAKSPTPTELERRAESVERRPWFEGLARVGLSARTTIYLVLTLLTVDIALHGRSPTPADSDGVLHEVARQPGGPILLVVLAAGLGGYALWRVVSAIGSTDRRLEGRARRLGLGAIGAIYLVLCAEALLLAFGSRQNGGVSSNPRPVVAAVLRWPGGAELAGLGAAGLIAGGLGLLVWGVLHNYEDDLDRTAMGDRTFAIARAAGVIGDAVRGLLIVLLGAYLLTSAITDDPARVKGLDQAMQSLAHEPAGVWLLSAAAVGLFSFAVYSGLEVRYRRV